MWVVRSFQSLKQVVLGPEGEGVGGDIEHRGLYTSDTPDALRSELVWAIDLNCGKEFPMPYAWSI